VSVSQCQYPQKCHLPWQVLVAYPYNEHALLNNQGPWLQVRFEQPICLTGIKVGAAPGTGPGAAVTPHIHLFAYDLSTLGAARFALLTENCTLPTSGTKAVRIEVSRQSLSESAYLPEMPSAYPSIIVQTCTSVSKLRAPPKSVCDMCRLSSPTQSSCVGTTRRCLSRCMAGQLQAMISRAEPLSVAS